MPKKKHSRKSASKSESEEEAEQYVVEVIKAARVRNGDWEFRVKWANYDSSEDTWEPKENLNNCGRLLDSFLDNIGRDNGDYPEGYKVKATPSWIKREKERFARSLKTPESESDDEEERSESEPISQVKVKSEPSISSKAKGKEIAKPPGKKRGRPPKHKPSKESSSDGDSDVPLSATRRRAKKRAKVIVDSADEDDEMLARHKKPRPTITIPKPSRVQDKADSSDSAGSLFSERASSPDVALGSVAPPIQMKKEKPTVPMKRPSTDDANPMQRKRSIKMMPVDYTDTAGNATKARVAQRMAQTSTQPVASGPRTGTTQTLPPTLRFKKKAPESSSPSTATAPPLPRRTASDSAHVQSPTTSAHPTPVIDSHIPAVVSQHPPPPTDPRRAFPPIPRRNPSTLIQSPVIDNLAEANRFLSEAMPSALASPMQDEPASEMPPPSVVRSISAKSLPRIQKKWKWSGEVFMDVSRDRAERVCEVLLSDSTDPLPNGLRFSICLTGDSIRLSAFHSLESMHLLLSASSRAQQFAKLGPFEDKDADAVKQLGLYMRKQSMFCFAHLYLDDTSVALLVVYPTGHAIPKGLLKIPSTLSTDTPLQVALVPWELTTKEFQSASWRPRSPIVERRLDPDFAPILDTAGRRLTKDRRFYQAAHFLGFPKSLYDNLNQGDRKYSIWFGPEVITSTSTGYDSVLLRKLLTKTKATYVSTKAQDHIRLLFVHVGGLATLHKLPRLAERRATTDVRFITYGTHPSVPRERWGMREIYPLGGIVSFTPSAIIEGHLRLFNRIEQIAEHPTWECYVLPSVVAMVAKLTCQGEHPLRVYDEGNFVYEDLLKLIEQGSIALLNAPQVNRDSLIKGDPTLLWTQWMLRVPFMNARQILEECIKLAAEEFACTADHDLPRAIEMDIVVDMLRMQNQPVIMDNYRRFVVIQTKNDAYLAQDAKGRKGFECSTLEKFDFNDGYYKSSANSMRK